MKSYFHGLNGRIGYGCNANGLEISKQRTDSNARSIGSSHVAGWDEGVIGGMDLWAKFLEE
jgi:hypothetical protein